MGVGECELRLMWIWPAEDEKKELPPFGTSRVFSLAFGWPVESDFGAADDDDEPDEVRDGEVVAWQDG